MSSVAVDLFDFSDDFAGSWGTYQDVPRRARYADNDTDAEMLDLLDEIRSPKVLLAEDDEQMRVLLTEELRDAGYHVFAVSDGESLLRCLKGKVRACPVPDLVISDVRMPGASGISVLRKLRKSDWTMPVVIITAFGDERIHAEARELGAATVLDKPFDMEDLIYAARSLVPTVAVTQS